MKSKINKVEHIWCSSDDRWVYIEYDTHLNVIGLNFMQGDEYEVFKRNYSHSDQGLTKFHEEMLCAFPLVDGLSFINKCMWLFHSVKMSAGINCYIAGDDGGKQCCGKV